MKTTRREFLAAAAAAPVLSPILLGTQDKAGTKAPVLGSGAYTYEAIHDWGELPAAHQVGQHPRRRRGLAGEHLRPPHRARDERQRRLDGGVRPQGQVRPLVGKEFSGVAHGLHIRKEGQRRVPLPDRQRRESADDAAAGAAGGRGEGDAEGGDRLEDRRVRRTSTPTSRPPTARRSATTRPTSRSRRTATSTSATATARPTSISTTARRSTSAPSAARAPRPDS